MFHRSSLKRIPQYQVKIVTLTTKIQLFTFYLITSAAKSQIMDGRKRENIEIGLEVEVVLKKDQGTGALTHGFVKRILTNSKFHPHGIKVMLDDGKVGRVQEIVE